MGCSHGLASSNVIKQNYRYLNFQLLMPHLIEEDILDLTDLVDREAAERRFTSSLIENPRYYERIAARIERETNHLGHRYISSLLAGRPPNTDDAIVSESAKWRSLVSRNFSSVVQRVCVSSLLPHALEKELLTMNEADVLYKVANQHEAAMNLFRLLESKGPMAYYLFVQCLSEENTQPQHAELYRQLIDEFGDCYCEEITCKHTQVLESEGNRSSFRTPKQLEPNRLLNGREYNKRRLRFELYYHNGEWEKVKEEAGVCNKSKYPDIRVIGLLEMALSRIICSDNNHSPIPCIEDAQAICQSITGNNRSFLLGRCEYLLSLYFRYKADYGAARMHIEKAKGHLFDVASGEDKSFVYYCDASLQAECLSDESPAADFEQVKRLYENARDNARYASLDILVVYTDLQLSRLYLGTTHTKISFTKDKDRIRMARNCLLRIEKNLEELDLRRKSLFYLNMADWHYTCNHIDCAIENAKKANQLAQTGNLHLEIKASEARIRLFSQQCKILPVL